MEIKQALSCLAALSQESRLTVFRLLVRRGEDGMPAGEIAERLDVPGSTLSFHLKELEQAGLLAVRRDGRRMIYAVDYGVMGRLLNFLREDCCRDHPGLDPVCESGACDPD